MWTKLAQLRFHQRCLVKAAIFCAVLAVVLYPHPIILGKQIQHLRNLESLIQPGLPALAQINAEISGRLPASVTPKAECKAVERYVYDRIKFQYDWDNWGNVDYWPTAAEVWERQREDCDGRAVLAVSILRSRGFQSARLVGNLTHIWVAVDDTELMGPKADKNFRREGGKTVLSLPSKATLLESLAMVREFPAVRSLIILLATLVLCYHPCQHRAGFTAVAVVALLGYALLMSWAGAHLKGQVKGVDLSFLAGISFLGGSGLLALFLPRLLNWRERLLPTAMLAPDGQR